MTSSITPRPSFRLLAAALALGALSQGRAGAQEAQKQYTLFEGASIAVNIDNVAYPVRDVNGSSWVIAMNGEEKVVNGAAGPINLKIVPGLRLTEDSATITGYKKEGAYTFANDPAVKLTRGLAQTASIDAGYHAALNQSSAVDPLSLQMPPASGTGNTVTTGVTSQAQVTSTAASASATAGIGATQGLKEGQNDEGFDALKIEFSVESQKPIPAPYIVTTARFHPHASMQGTVQSLVFAKALEPIGPKPSKVSFTEEGFPVGYDLVDFQIHLYNAGVEIATNIAEKREVMNPDQAFGYVKRTYVEAHKADTLRASPVMGSLPADFASKVAAGKYTETIYVKVSPEGMATAAYSDGGCEKPIEDPYLDGVLKGIRFKPALLKGAPVKGVASINLSHVRM